MSDMTTLACWPSCVDAIDWSEDGIIAVASEEQVELLFPQTKSNDWAHDFSAWHHIPLPVSWFTPEELPEKVPAPRPITSIGEEYSASVPVCIAWSPPGLAKYRRCALGVLSSTLILSLWASEGGVDDDRSWKRKMIINDALAEYFYRNVDELESHLVDGAPEKIRIRSRIRCFHWAPPLPGLKPTFVIGTQPVWTRPILAIANDDNQLAFVAVDSPVTAPGVESNWSAEVLDHFSIKTDSGNDPQNTTYFDEMMHQQRHVSQLAWSPWVTQGDRQCSVLVYATNHDVRGRIITYDSHKINIGCDEVVYSDINARFAGPMKWSPKIEDGEIVTLAVFTLEKIIIAKISAIDANIQSRTEHDLGGRWDETSATVWDHTAPDTAIHFASMQETLKYSAGLKLAGNKLSPIPRPHWCEQLWDAQALFSAEHELSGKVRTKVWGLSTSPLGDFIAACSTLHPSNMIEFGPPNERRTSVAISGLRGFDQQDKLEIPTRNCSAEGLGFTLRKWAERMGDGDEFSSAAIEQLSIQLFEKHWIPDAEQTKKTFTTPASLEDVRQLIDDVKQHILLNDQTIKDRCTILVSRTCAPSAPIDLPRALIAYRLATSSHKLSSHIARNTAFSSELLKHHRHVISLLDFIMTMGEETPTEEPKPNETALPCDICDFCQSDIYMNDVITATCTKGHEFPRCGLSLIAIQQPRISKHCALCETPYLTDEFVRLQEEDKEDAAVNTQATDGPEAANGGEDVEMTESNGNAEDDSAKAATLASVLFQACDVCIYCGGKFTG